MRFTQIALPKVVEIQRIPRAMLSESEDNQPGGKNTHLEHLEDLIFNKGYKGGKEAIDYLYSVYEMLKGHSKGKTKMTRKWDGAPAIFAGINPENGKFFVGTKSIFNAEPKINYTESDIDRNHGHAAGLTSKLKVALKLLKPLNWNGRVVQGDFLWTSEDLQTSVIDGKSYVTFTPNTLTYAAPADSDLGKSIANSPMGVVWHTEYVGGPTLQDMSSNFGFDHTSLGDSKNVWQTDAGMPDVSGTATLTQTESDAVYRAIAEADNYRESLDPKVFGWLDSPEGKDFKVRLKKHVNDRVRAGSFGDPQKFAKEFLQDYLTYLQGKADKLKTEKGKERWVQKQVEIAKYIQSNATDMAKTYDLYMKVIQAKLVLIRKLETLTDLNVFAQEGPNFVATGDEGFVAVDHLGSGIKLVDRLEFSRLNFGSGKPGGK
jgi:hypothetical protein